MPFEFHFLRPWWLLAMMPLAALVWRQWRTNGDATAWRGIVDAHLLSRLLSGDDSRAARLPLILLTLGGVLLVVALAGPTWQRLPQALFQAPQYRVIALDLSPSMNATDLKPSRLARARYEVLDLLRRSSDAQTALVAYGAEPYVVSPLTADADTIAAQVPLLETGLLPVIGERRTELALASGGELLRQAGAPGGDVILVTDDPGNPDRVQVAAARLLADGYRVSVLGVGTPQGGPVTLRDGALLKDDTGAIVVPQLDAGGLAALASAGGGRYVNAALGDRDLEQLLTTGLTRHADDAKRHDATSEQWREEGPWLLLLLLPLAALAFRRGWLSPLSVVMLFIVSPPDAYALSWDDLWLRADQQAMRHMESGRPEQAMPKFERPDWRAAAAYRAGNYDAALELLDADGTHGAYNRGNTLARLGRLDEAVEAYDQALRNDPNDADARHNRDLVQQLRERREQQQKEAPRRDPPPPESPPESSSESSSQQATPNDAQQSDDDQARQGAQDEQNAEQSQKDQSGEQDQQQSGEASQTTDKGEPQPGDEQYGGASSGSDTSQPGAAGNNAGQGEQAAGDDMADAGQDKQADGAGQNLSEAQDSVASSDERGDDAANPQSGDAERQPIPETTDANPVRENGGSAGEQQEHDAQADEQPQKSAGAQADDGDQHAQSNDDSGEGVGNMQGRAQNNRQGTEKGRSPSPDGQNEAPGNPTQPDHQGAMMRDRQATAPDRSANPLTQGGRPGLDDLLGGDRQATRVSGASQETAGGNSEDAQALEQMLRQVEDDPGGLLRQRFLLQHLRRNGRLP